MYALRRQRLASMIVTCTSCQTRFRVSGDKIGPRGARIRCGRCRAVFAVAPEAEADIAAAPPHAAPERAGPLLPPPLPKGSERAAPAAPPGSPFELDPFAPAGADPFEPAGAAQHAASPEESLGEDPFGIPAPGGEGWGRRGDPIDLPLPAPHSDHRPAAPLGAPLSQNPRVATDLSELLEGSAAGDSSGGVGSLSLEERDAPPIATPSHAAASGEYAAAFDHAGELGGLDLVGPEIPGRAEPFGLPDAEPGDPLSGLDLHLPPERAAAPPPVPRLTATFTDAPGITVTPHPAPVPNPAPAEPPAASGGGRFLPALANSLSLALLIAIAVGLFAAWRGGLATRLAFARSPAPLVEVSGLRGGLYETETGPAVLVVRGQVGARAPVGGPVRVRVELVEDGRVLAEAVGLAGATATPEEVFGAGAPEEAAALRRALDERAAGSLRAGAPAPFLVLFPPPAPDPRSLELRARAEPTGGVR